MPVSTKLKKTPHQNIKHINHKIWTVDRILNAKLNENKMPAKLILAATRINIQKAFCCRWNPFILQINLWLFNVPRAFVMFHYFFSLSLSRGVSHNNNIISRQQIFLFNNRQMRFRSSFCLSIHFSRAVIVDWIMDMVQSIRIQPLADDYTI